MVRPRRISDFKPTFTNLAQTSHYQVFFAGLPLMLRQHLRVRGLDSRFITETSGLLCSGALLPGSRLATADIVGNHVGVSEKMAHTRLFTQIQLEFYVDNKYKTLKFLEHWMEFIANGATSRDNRQSNKDYYFRMEYPDTYKCDETKIIKFDRDYNEELEYKFVGLFPLDLTSTPVKYEQSQVLRATATFSFDRYLMGKYDSFSVARGRSGNRLPELAPQNADQAQLEAALNRDTGGKPNEPLMGTATRAEASDILKSRQRTLDRTIYQNT